MTATPKHSIWSLCLILITALLTGCASTVGITDDKPNGFAYVEIEGSHQALIKAGAIQVFSQEEGFKVVSDSGNQVRFTKPGTKATTVLYGTSFNTNSTAIEPELSIVALDNGNHRLHCEVYVVNLRVKCTSNLRIKVHHSDDDQHHQNGTTGSNHRIKGTGLERS